MENCGCYFGEVDPKNNQPEWVCPEGELGEVVAKHTIVLEDRWLEVTEDGYATIIYELSKGTQVRVQFQPHLLEPTFSEGSGMEEVILGDIIFKMIREDQSWSNCFEVTGRFSDLDTLYKDVIDIQRLVLNG
jgi:hypothetical protein